MGENKNISDAALILMKKIMNTNNTLIFPTPKYFNGELQK